MATYHFIRHDDFEDTLALSEALLYDEQDLVHKITGWMLREVGKRDPDALTAFLDRYVRQMPRTMLRYAIEKMRPTCGRIISRVRTSAIKPQRGPARQTAGDHQGRTHCHGHDDFPGGGLPGGGLPGSNPNSSNSAVSAKPAAMTAQDQRTVRTRRMLSYSWAGVTCNASRRDRSSSLTSPRRETSTMAR